MSRHWNPQEELARHDKTRWRKVWPNGATAGLLMVAGLCIGVGLVMYRVAGPRDIIAGDAGE